MSQLMDHANRAQKKTREYLDKHMIDSIIGEMLNTLIQVQDEKPLIFMVWLFY